MKSKFSKVLSVITTIVLALSVILVGIGIYDRVTGKRLIPYTMTWILTDSMEPTIEAQSFVLMKYVDDVRELEEGDIITFIAHGSAISGEKNTHRIQSIVGDYEGFITKGDNPKATVDDPIDASDVIAVYICNLDMLTAFGRFFIKPQGLATVLIVFTLLFIILGSSNRKKYQKELREYKIREAIDAEIKRLESENKK